jgi:predicted acylesterase/phospholipase RssA
VTIERLRNAKRVGLLFSGGSSRCIFQVGVVEALYGLGIRPAVTLGVSAGSWNAACVAVGNWRRLRSYWRFFCRMPYVDLTNLLREHSPFIWRRIHQRAFDRYIGAAAIASPSTLPLFVSLTRLRDDAPVIVDARQSSDPFTLLLASNFLQPFYTHAQSVDGELCGDGGWTDAIPYQRLLDEGCDAVVVMTSKGESEGGIYRNPNDFEHVIDDERIVVIRPRYRMPLAFVERRWEKLAPMADLGALRTREVLLGERHPQCDVAARGPAPTAYVSAVRSRLRRLRRQAIGDRP